MRNVVLLSSFLALTALTTGCPDRTISQVLPQQGRVEFKDIPVTVNRDVDILFLIDDSPSMADKQSNLRKNFPDFINVLNTIQGGLPNIHLGVATSDLGSKGADDAQPGPGIGTGAGACSGNGKAGNLHGDASITGPYISDTKTGTAGTTCADGGRLCNYTGTLADAFSAIATVGVAGCGFEQHLEAVKRALNNNPSNTGFLRATAFLAVIIIGDEDDCSMAHSTLIGSDTNTLGPLASFRCTRFGVTCDQGGADPGQMNQVGTKSMCHSNENGGYLTDVKRYIDFLKSLKTDPKQVIVADIGAPPDMVATELRPLQVGGTPIPALAHSCTYTDVMNVTEVGDPTVRVSQFLNGFPNRSTYSNICQNDLSGALQQIAQLLKLAIGSPCIDGNLKVPYECSVSDVTMYGTPTQNETILPECDNMATPASSSNKPCWAIESDPTNCSANSHLTLKVERSTQPPPDDHVISYCVTQAM